MPKPDPVTGERNLIRHKLVKLRQKRNWSQRILSYKAQLAGCDMDKNAITRIENNRRYVTDMELIAFAGFSMSPSNIFSTAKRRNNCGASRAAAYAAHQKRQACARLFVCLLLLCKRLFERDRKLCRT